MGGAYLLFLDELTSGLDELGERSGFANLLAQYAGLPAARQGVFDLKPVHAHTALWHVWAAKLKINPTLVRSPDTTSPEERSGGHLTGLCVAET